MLLTRFATLWFAVLVGFIALAILRAKFPALLAGGEKDREAEAAVRDVA